MHVRQTLGFDLSFSRVNVIATALHEEHAERSFHRTPW
jgi:hypothetical protein